VFIHEVYINILKCFSSLHVSSLCKLCISAKIKLHWHHCYLLFILFIGLDACHPNISNNSLWTPNVNIYLNLYDLMKYSASIRICWTKLFVSSINDSSFKKFKWFVGIWNMMTGIQWKLQWSSECLQKHDIWSLSISSYSWSNVSLLSQNVIAKIIYTAAPQMLRPSAHVTCPTSSSG